MAKERILRFRCTQFEYELAEKAARKLRITTPDFMRNAIRIYAAAIGLFNEWPWRVKIEQKEENDGQI